MARLPRLAVAGQVHLVQLRGHGGRQVFMDDVDRRAFLSALRTACEHERVAVHAYALLPGAVWLLLSPASADGIGRAIQALGRGFSASFNRRHGRSGSLWDGRHRSSVIEAGEPVLWAMVFVDQASVREGLAIDVSADEWSSAGQHAGFVSRFALTDAASYWLLGNTPFERSAAYAVLVNERLADAWVEQLSAAVRRGWPIGSPMFLDALKRVTPRPVEPRPRGRPRKNAAA